jgi:protein involved in polysaccharide export with SLBB domain
MPDLGSTDYLETLYKAEQALGWFLAPLGIPLSPVLVSGDIADPGIYNIPSLSPVTYYAAGSLVSDTYTGVSLWNLLSDAGGVNVTSAKNDILSKYVVASSR